jgi:hypothetical protein
MTVADVWLGWACLAKKGAARGNHAHRHRLQNLYKITAQVL